MVQLAQRSKDLKESPIVMFGALAAQREDAIKLNSGSPGHGPITEVSDALKKVTASGVSTYKTHPYGSPHARLNASKYYMQRYGIQFDPESHINVTTGFTHLFKSICETLINPGDLVALANPVFPQYIQPIRLSGGKITYFEAEEENSWKPDPLNIKKVLEKNVRMIVLNYPNNPTGATLNWEELNQLIDLFSIEIRRREKEGENDFIVVLDDAYVPLYHNHQGKINKCPTFGAALQKRILEYSKKENDDQIDYLHKLMRNSIIACSLSKEGMAGVLCGMGASKNEKLINAMRIPGKSSVISVSTFGEVALESLVNSSGATLEWASCLYSNRTNQLSQGLNDIAQMYNLGTSYSDKVVNLIPSAGMYVYTNFSSLLGLRLAEVKIKEILKFLETNKLSAKGFFTGGKFGSNFDIALWLLLDVGVAVVPMGDPKSGYLRFSVGIPQAIEEDMNGCVNKFKTEQKGTQLIRTALNRISIGFREITELNRAA